LDAGNLPQLKSPTRKEVRVDDKLLLTVDEAAERLGIGRSHAYVFVMRGEIPSIKLGRSRRVPASALPEFVERLRSDQPV
jgi:excisionase family DNA binding protein